MRLLIASALTVGLACATVRADEILDQLDTARQLYQDGDLAGAVRELEFALEALRAKFGEAFVATFPKPPAGWTIEDRPGNPVGIPLLGGTTVVRIYRQIEGSGEIEAQLSRGGVLQGLAQMLANPQLLLMQANAKRVRIQREMATTSWNPDTKEGQLVLDLSGKVTIFLRGSGLSGPEPLIELASRWDLERVRMLAGR